MQSEWPMVGTCFHLARKFEDISLIICHCNHITDKEILEIAARLHEENPQTPIRSNLIYRGRGCKAKCGCCRPMIEALLLDNGYEVSVTQADEIDRLRQRRFYAAPNSCPGFS